MELNGMNSLKERDELDHGLAAGTLVTTPDGDKKIEEVKAGDLVLGGVGSSYLRFHEVKKATAKSHHGPILRVDVNSGQQLRATPNHVCFAKVIRDIAVDKVSIVAFAGFDVAKKVSSHIVSTPDTWELVEGRVDYAEEVALIRSISAGRISIERGAHFGAHILEYTRASDLEIGLKVPTIRKTYFSQPDKKQNNIFPSAIKNITEEQYDGLVYDLDIPEARNFAANGVLVHDSTSVVA